MVQAKGLAENVASGIGFFAAVFVLILLGMIVPSPELEEDNDGNECCGN